MTLYTKSARVWIKHSEKVWEAAVVVENYKGQVLKNDLTSLSYLQEPVVMYNLQVRFCMHSAIYTNCGIVLSEAYKEVPAKYAMRYFATVGGSAEETSVEKKALASNPIMEAIGNEKTTHNNNSSSFGKFIEIYFNKKYHIQGASIQTYPLEKFRIVFQTPDERNYIFYQLCAVHHNPQFPSPASPDIDDVSDEDMFKVICNVLIKLNFSEEQQENMWKILTAILHLGNEDIEDAAADNGESSAIKADDHHLLTLCELLDLTAADFRSWLCLRKIVSIRAVIFKNIIVDEAHGSLEKNRDTVLEDQINVLKSSKNKLVRMLFRDESDEGRLIVPAMNVKVVPTRPSHTVVSKHKKSVGSQFQDSLNTLMGTLNAITPHYVCCIKPNDHKKPFKYNTVKAVQQLRARGDLETIRISSAGFPSSWTYADFLQRYRMLCKHDTKKNNMKATSEKILNIQDPDKFKYEKTNIFSRAGQVTYLETLRADKLLRHVLGWVKRTQYAINKCVLSIHTYARGYLAKRHYRLLLLNHKAIIIHKYMRGWLARRKCLHKRRCFIIAQLAVCRWLARCQLKNLKQNVRSFEHVKKLNKGLENKIIPLQQRIEELVKENSSVKSVQHEVQPIGAEERMKTRPEQEKIFLISVQDQGRDAYQKLVAE
ncbi:hypothetical protein PR048_008206 [Dryococelus australis]|uniref:Myosin motor domain-containing protein n=1 Tax=Dryococelus australis TaxID=614101 RepID=A0ABQ9HX96_9NEOP|nr:hypothetical protein PR048_008206 [Dryococelus australis]